MTEEITRSIETGLSCYRTCLSTAMNHCLEPGGKARRGRTFPADDGLRGNLSNVAAC
jgi:hypothetical protein